VSSELESFLGEAPATGFREGLPKNYRMRHDAHYVDQLTSRGFSTPVRMISVDEIDAEPPAGYDVSALTESIRQVGLLQPLLVRSDNARFAVIAGAKRFAAARAAHLTEVPCLVHSVDEARARQLAEAAGVSGVAEEFPTPAVPADTQLLAFHDQLVECLETAVSSLSLLPEAGRSLRENVARDLIQSELTHAAWLAQARHILSHDALMTWQPVDLRDLLRDVVAGFTPLSHLTRTELLLEQTSGETSITADAKLLEIAFHGVLRAMQRMGEAVRKSRLRVVLAGSTPSEGPVKVSIVQEAISLPMNQVARLFDETWTERPGGYSAALAFAVARRIAGLQGGTVEAGSSETGGWALSFTFAKA
jgi:hypothetical protein